MLRYFKTTLLCSVLLIPLAAGAQDRDDRRENRQEHRYEDRAHHDAHDWNQREDEAYRRYLQEHHQKYRDFSKLGRRQQNSYWTWRHNHADNDERDNRRHDRR